MKPGVAPVMLPLKVPSALPPPAPGSVSDAIASTGGTGGPLAVMMSVTGAEITVPSEATTSKVAEPLLFTVGCIKGQVNCLSITWVTGCTFNFKTTMYVEEQTGADNPFVGRMEEDVLWFTFMFVKRKVRMGDWIIGGTGTCPDCCEFVPMNAPTQ